MNRKKISLKKQFKEARNYLMESSVYVLSVVLLFVASALIGVIFSSKLTFLDSLLKDIVLNIINLNEVELIFFILQNNLYTSFIGFISGIFFGIPTIIVSISNGVVIGYVMSLAVSEAGLFELWRLLPHGIFELPAVFISLGLGLKMSGFIISKNKIKELKRRFYNSINVFLFIIVPLLTIAAIIEGLLIHLI